MTEAREEVRAACPRDPQFYVARVVLALTAASLGSKEEAVAALIEARRLRPRLSLNEIQLLVGRRAAILAPLWSEISKSSE
jgi:adenylate cyclase